MTITASASPHGLRTCRGPRYVAIPEPGLSLTQDAEWCVVRLNENWRQIRFHDYARLYRIPGLYERLFYDILKCDSPRTVRRLLEKCLGSEEVPPSGLRVLDLGAGNGMVGEQLAALGVPLIVGVDIIAEAAEAATRDRPGVYDDYLVADMTCLTTEELSRLVQFEFNCLTCVAALGFNDIPPEAFVKAYNLVSDGGWIAFNIKEDFLAEQDESGFSCLIREVIRRDLFEIHEQRKYRHRLATDGSELHYVAVVGRKLGDVDLGSIDRL